MNLDLERSQREHWKRELDKRDNELCGSTKLSREAKYNSWGFFEQRYRSSENDQTLLQDMFEASQQEVNKLESKLLAVEYMLAEAIRIGIRNND